MADKDDDLLESVTGMADRMGLEGSERRKYIHEHMTRGGYRAVPQYVKGDDDDDDDDRGSGFFGSGSRRRSRDDDRGGRRRRPSRDSDDSWYDD